MYVVRDHYDPKTPARGQHAEKEILKIPNVAGSATAADIDAVPLPNTSLSKNPAECRLQTESCGVRLVARTEYVKAAKWLALGKARFFASPDGFEEPMDVDVDVRFSKNRMCAVRLVSGRVGLVFHNFQLAKYAISFGDVVVGSLSDGGQEMAGVDVEVPVVEIVRVRRVDEMRVNTKKADALGMTVDEVDCAVAHTLFAFDIWRKTDIGN
ncbi:hypothetical protein HK100_009112 [Physocladia obscura]|uniref:Uncharacterized protein n=1 Tax=Physocladia obscura TaxID=109957 RepID=A0AAD5XJG4_9FUNG|nr:hypothetical protein HK100_009112 [Physocladia obscura]